MAANSLNLTPGSVPKISTNERFVMRCSLWGDREIFEASALCLGSSDKSDWPVWCGTGKEMAVAATISDCNSTFSKDTVSFGLCSWTSAAVWGEPRPERPSTLRWLVSTPVGVAGRHLRAALQPWAGGRRTW